MAEIIRTETSVQISTLRPGGTISQLPTTTEVRTVVRSIHGSDASMVRNFVRALDAADAPGTARVDQRTQDHRLIGLIAEWTTHPDASA